MICVGEGAKRKLINQIDSLYICIDKNYNGGKGGKGGRGETVYYNCVFASLREVNEAVNTRKDKLCVLRELRARN
jgi:hypothetical protein